MLGNLRVRLDDGELEHDQQILAEVCFSKLSYNPENRRQWPIGLEALPARQTKERWLVSEAVSDSELEDFHVSSTSDWSWLGRECADTDALAPLSEQLFLQLHRAATALQHAHVARLWVIIPHIHTGEGDAERYKQFCLGRHRAYEQLGIVAPNYPAATVIGSYSGPIRMHVLLCREAGDSVENPKQTAAYHYPREYGPRSPSFSRALRLQQHLFVSGTAAIRGSQSQNPGELLPQLQTIDENLQALCSDFATPWHESAAYGRIYLRQAEHATAIRSESTRLWPGSIHWPVLHGDICRRELLCEVETGL